MRRLYISLCFAVLAGCSHGAVSAPAIPPTTDAQVLSGQASPDAGPFTSLYSFKGAPDGAFPLAGLTHFGGLLYGTTSQGGTVTANGDGTAFSISPAGKERVLYSFQGSPDGQFPQAAFDVFNGTLYGTTPNGGNSGNGTVFTLSKGGSENVLYRFGTSADGIMPAAALIDVNGTFYGTTSGGGGADCNSGFGCGTVFSLHPAGNEHVVYAFAGGLDGQLPVGELVYAGGALYGATFFGGGSGCNFRGCGTIFKLDPATGTETVLYSFKGGADGANPSAGLTPVKNEFFGTTSQGGGSNNDGTVFKITRAGRESVLHRFKGRPDGVDPEAGLVFAAGALYGTTYFGGKRNMGTVYSLTPAGNETIVHSFTGPDGENPQAPVIELNGRLYGTTKDGGASGSGTVFSAAP